MDSTALIEQLKARPDAHRIGMILTHQGIVRGTSRDGTPVSSLTVTVDHERLAAILAEQRQRPGIVDIVVEIAEGRLSVGDDLMLLAVAGDIRENVIPVLTDTLNAVKATVTGKNEHPV